MRCCNQKHGIFQRWKTSYSKSVIGFQRVIARKSMREKPIQELPTNGCLCPVQRHCGHHFWRPSWTRGMRRSPWNLVSNTRGKSMNKLYWNGSQPSSVASKYLATFVDTYVDFISQSLLEVEEQQNSCPFRIDIIYQTCTVSVSFLTCEKKGKHSFCEKLSLQKSGFYTRHNWATQQLVPTIADTRYSVFVGYLNMTCTCDVCSIWFATPT